MMGSHDFSVKVATMADLRRGGEPGENREDVHQAWAAEIERRARRVLGGGSEGVPWKEVKRRIEARLSRSAKRNDQRAAP